MSNGYAEENEIFEICAKEALLKQALEAKQLERQAELIGQHLEKYLDRKLASSHCEPAHLMEIRRLRALCIEAANLLTTVRMNSDLLCRPWEHGGVDLVTRLLEAGKPHG